MRRRTYFEDKNARNKMLEKKPKYVEKLTTKGIVDIKMIMDEINRAYENMGECSICFEEDKLNIILEPCGHNCVCLQCAKEIINKNMECPVCRTQVTGTIKLFN